MVSHTSHSTDAMVRIVGGGLAGLMAAITLAQRGRAVTLFDPATKADGHQVQRSVHTSQFNLEKTCSFLGMDLSECFESVTRETVYFYGRRMERDNVTYACERGDGSGSLDHALRTVARKKGVTLVSKTVHADDNILKGAPIVLATGLHPHFYEKLGILHVRVWGYEATMPSTEERSLISFKDTYTHEDFAYVAAKNGIVYTLLFSRNGIDSIHLDQYQDHLRRETGLSFPKWRKFEGCIPLYCRLHAGKYILAGTLSGVIDPFFLSGVIGALVSGKIAASALIGAPDAAREYQRFVKYFGIKQRLHRLMQSRLLPGLAKLPLIVLHKILGDVGKP
jgi:flavin-dependent dehydrogenase